jgi:hypothetical protein
MPTLNLSDESLNAVIGQAILGQLTPEAREQILKDAVKSLLETPKDSGPYSLNRKPRIVEAFETAAYSTCIGVARDFLANDETVKVEMERLLRAAWAKMLENEQDVVERLARALSDIFREK